MEYEVFSEYTYGIIPFGKFDSLNEAMERVKLIEGISEMLDTIEHCEVPHFHVFVSKGGIKYFSDGSGGN